MEKKIYKVMRKTSALNIAIGILTLVIGVTSGVLMIVSGAILGSSKKQLFYK